MAEHSRYKVTAKQAGIEKDVLINKLNIINQKTLDDTETLLLQDTYTHFIALSEKGEITINLSLLFSIHTYFLGTLYPWAGKIRKVDISKDNVLFASVRYINSSLKAFEKILKKNIPKESDSKKITAKKLAIIHNEINAIHPFRDGNGRTIRLLLDLLAVHSGYQLIDYAKSSKQEYTSACVAGMVRNNEKLEKILHKGLKKK
jgi:cell filamentation protein